LEINSAKTNGSQQYRKDGERGNNLKIRSLMFKISIFSKIESRSNISSWNISSICLCSLKRIDIICKTQCFTSKQILFTKYLIQNQWKIYEEYSFGRIHVFSAITVSLESFFTHEMRFAGVRNLSKAYLENISFWRVFYVHIYMHEARKHTDKTVYIFSLLRILKRKKTSHNKKKSKWH